MCVLLLHLQKCFGCACHFECAYISIFAKRKGGCFQGLTPYINVIRNIFFNLIAIIYKFNNSKCTIIFQTVWHFASASSLKFSHDDYNKDNDWIFNLNEISISNTNQTINDQSHLVCVEHGFVVNKIHTSINKTVHKKFNLKVQRDMQGLFI